MRHRLDDGQIEVVDEAVAAVLRTKTGAERVAMALQCNRTVRLVIEGSVRMRHPDWDDKQVAAEVARRMTRGSD